MGYQFQIFLDIFERTATIYFGVALGFIFVKSPLKKYRKAFIQFTISIITPFLIIVSFLRIKSEASLIFPIVGAILVTIIGIIIPNVIYKIKGNQKPEPAEICTAAFPNALNFPFPIIFAFAPDSLGLAGVFLVVTVILRNTVGLRISGVDFNRRELKSIISFPPIWGILLAFLLKPLIDVNHPMLTANWVEFLFQIGIIMTIMTIGFSLSKPDLTYVEPMIRVGISRFLISGIVVILIIMVFSPSKLIAIPLIVQMISPPAVYNGLYAEKFNLNTELTAQVILILTLIALVFLPIELFILQNLFDLS